MNLDKIKVEYVAKLAKLPLFGSEKEEFTEQLSKILEYVSKLNSFKAGSTPPTFNSTKLINITRPDQNKAYLSAKESLQNAPAQKNNLFVSKGVFENE